jgi:hypothetical protein
MAPVQLPLGLAQRHANQQLFSDYYLDQILPQRPDWQQLVAEAAPVLAQLRAIFASYTPSSIEAQTEDGWIKPVLAALGHTTEVQAALKTPDGTKRPDYVFYRDGAARVANSGKTLDDTLPTQGALAVGDAKAWDRPLDSGLKSKGGDPFSNKNPSFQIAFYIQHAGLPWGILTNGRIWRLYHQASAHKLDRYYAVDLPALLEANDPAAFLYFYAFFRRAAFDRHDLGLDQLLKASTDYAHGVGDTLKQQVYAALRHLAQGLLDYGPNGLTADPPTLQTIYDHCLIVLYRLLFVLYAEARELLPLRANEQYRRHYSLDALKREVARTLDGGTPLLADLATLWPRLRALFGIVHAGRPVLQVSTFNGGLFDPARYPFLEQHSVGDARLIAALDLLTRVGGQFVDYRDLAERHLGTIYEGLLEYHLEPAADPSGQFSIDLFDSQGERHRTGSYYTPYFVVQYIIDQTLKPLLDQAVAGATTDEAKIAAVLGVNVLDPAMGSGHFPVAATEYIARYLIDLNVSPGPDAGGEADLAYWKRRVAQNCIYGVDLNPLAVDLAKLSLWLSTAAKDKPLSFLDHHLRCGNAVVGVRVTELDLGGSTAKKQRPARQVQAAVAAGQLSMLDDQDFTRSMSTAVDAMWLIERTAGNTLAEVKEQEGAYAAVREHLTRRYAHLADLATAGQGFGLAVDRTLWPELVRQAGRGPEAIMLPAISRLLQQANAVAGEQHFFHWDLEFPEVFFDRVGQPLGERAGFDAVIGNPPYVRQEQLAPYKAFLATAFPETYHGAADLFVYFYHQGLRLLRGGGRLSYIVTNKWLRAGYGEPLRGYFAHHARIERLIDFGHAPIFPDADVFPCIIVLEKPGDEPDQVATDGQVQVTAFPREALKLTTLESYVARYSHPVPQARLGRAAWSLEASDVDDLMAKIRAAGVPLTEYAGVKPYYGIKTGLNEAFLIDTPTKERLVREDPRSAAIIKPYLRGQDIKRWSPEWDGLWMIFARRGIDIEAYPAIKQHLLQFRTQLEPRPKDWTDGAWAGRKPGSYKWYELQDTVDYWSLFEQPKLIWKDLSTYSEFCIDQRGLFTNDLCFILQTADIWMLSVLNSPLMWYYLSRTTIHAINETLRLKNIYMEQLPIAPPTDATRAEVEPAVQRLIAIAQADQEARRDTLDWLRTEFGIEQAGQKLAAFSSLSEQAFIDEVRKRRPKAAGVLTPAGLKALRAGYAEQATPVQQRVVEAQALEQRLAALVNAAYGLSAADVELLWRTAPPRMPVGRGE